MSRPDFERLFLAHLRKSEYSDNTILQYGAVVRAFIEFAGESRVVTCNEADVGRFLESTASGWSFRRALPALRVFFDTIMPYRKRKANPARVLDYCDRPQPTSMADVRAVIKRRNESTQLSADSLLGLLITSPLDEASRRVIRDYLAQEHPYTRRLLRELERVSAKPRRRRRR